MKVINEKYENGFLIRKFKTVQGTPFFTYTKCEDYTENLNGEIAISDNSEYLKTPQNRPTEEHLRDMRYIKQIRKNNAISDAIKPEHPLNNDMISLVKTRGQNRQNALKELCLSFVGLMKQREVTAFSYDEINGLFDGLNSRSVERVRSEFIKLLKSLNLVTETEQNKTYYSFRNKGLFSFDYGSFNLMLKHSKFNKGCIADSNLSMVREPIKRTLKVFVLN